MNSLTISAYFLSFAEREVAVSKSLAIPVLVMALVNSPAKVLRLASFALAVVNLLWAFTCMFESHFVTECFVLRAGQGVAKSFVEVASSSIGLRSAGPKRAGEALGIIFSVRAAGMLVGLMLCGVLFQVGGYPAPGVPTSVLIFVTGLLTLILVSLVEHEHARQADIGFLELLVVPGFNFVPGADHVHPDRLLIPGSVAADERGRCTLQPGQFRFHRGFLLFGCGLPCEQRDGRAHRKEARRGCDRSCLHLGTLFDVPAAGPCAVCLLRATADHRFVCLDGSPRIFCRWYHRACGDVDDEACCQGSRPW